MDKESAKTIEKKALGAVPGWVWGIIGVMLAFALMLRIIGFDVTTPVNRIMNAKAVAIEKKAELELQEKTGNQIKKKDLEAINKRLKNLERKKPAKKRRVYKPSKPVKPCR